MLETILDGNLPPQPPPRVEGPRDSPAMTTAATGPWTDAEIEAIVTDYFDMLRTEQRGEKYNKAAHNRGLQAHTQRSRGAIEYKYRNISAVLSEMGMPILRGYRPLFRYQGALAEAVDARLTGDPGLHEYLVGADRSIGHSANRDGSLRIGQPPVIHPTRRNHRPHRVTRKQDPALRDARNRALGKAGEEMVFRAECQRLRKAAREDLADGVRWIAQEEGDGAGFDILSFDLQGEKRLLEVKTTTGPSTTPFYLTENERRVSEEEAERYRLVRLYEFRAAPAAYRLRPPLDEWVRLDPMLYRVRLRVTEHALEKSVPHGESAS